MSNSKKSSSSRKKRELKRKVDDFSKSVGLSPLKIALSVVMLGAIGTLIFIVSFSNGTDKTKAAAAQPLSEQTIQQKELSIDQQLESLLKINVTGDANFLTIIKTMNDADEKLDELESSQSLTDSQKIQVEKIRLRNKSVVFMVMARNKLGCEAEKEDLRQYCQARIDSLDEELNEASRFWLCIIPTVEFTDAPSDETLAAFGDAIAKYPEGFMKAPQNAATISGLIFQMGRTAKSKMSFAKRGYQLLADQMVSSELADVRKIGKKLEGLVLFGEFNLPDLAHRIQWSEPSAPEDLRGAMQVLASNPNIEMKHWVTVIRANESFLATDRIEESGANWQFLRDLTDQISDQEKKETLQAILDRQRNRALQIGRPFDVNGSLLSGGKSISVGSHDYTAIIFCDKSRLSLNKMTKLGKQIRRTQLPYQPVLVFESGLSEKDTESLHMVPKGIAITDLDTSLKYQKAFPVDYFPYILLVDRAGIVVAANLDIDQVPIRIAKIESNERKAREARAREATQGPTVAQ